MCAIVGVYNIDDASRRLMILAHLLNHRGQEGTGQATWSNGKIHQFRRLGLVKQAYRNVRVSEELPGRMGIGHDRYPTAGDEASENNLQPFKAYAHDQDIAIVVNGNITNCEALNEELSVVGRLSWSTSDTELFLHLLVRSKKRTWVERLREVVAKVEGSYSLLLMTPDGIYAVTDPYGWRPLAMGKFEEGYMMASETCALDVFGIKSQCVPPGKIVEFTGEEPIYHDLFEPEFRRHCIFEHIYFANPHSRIWGVVVNAIRRSLGMACARRFKGAADMVVAVPDSANTMALMVAEALGLPYRNVIIRNHYVDRTFITSGQEEREILVRMKFGIEPEAVEGKRVILVDDSLVRGTTMRHVVEMLLDADAAEVHVVIASPPVRHPCFWGINTPSRNELIAAMLEVDGICEHIGATSLTYLEVSDILEAVGDPEGQRHCTTCFTCVPPIPGQILPYRD